MEEEKEVVAVQSISDQDKEMLEKLKISRQLALSQAETALAKNEASEAKYQFQVLQLFMKYGLDPQKDIIDEHYNLIKDGKK